MVFPVGAGQHTVADAGEIEAQARVARVRQGPGERDIEAVGADVVHRAGVEQHDGLPYAPRPRPAEDAEEPFVRPESTQRFLD